MSDQSWCKWKGNTAYWVLRGNAIAGSETRTLIAWNYPHPVPMYIRLSDYFLFYPGRMPCYVGEESACAQDSGFYGAWVTDGIAGPWKGRFGYGCLVITCFRL